MPLVDFDLESYWMLPGYFEGIENAGGLPIMFPLEVDSEILAQLLDQVDGLLFTGGQDISPKSYGLREQKSVALCQETCPERDEMEAKLLMMAIDEDIPVLGICRGIQSINAILGGTLYQDVKAQTGTKVKHSMKPPYDATAHTVEILPNTPLAELLDTGTLPVNSYHHQAVKEVAPELKPMAISEDGICEAVWRPESKFIWGVQWHPELSFRSSDASRKIFKAFIEACN